MSAERIEGPVTIPGPVQIQIRVEGDYVVWYSSASDLGAREFMRCLKVILDNDGGIQSPLYQALVTASGEWLRRIYQEAGVEGGRLRMERVEPDAPMTPGDVPRP